MSRKPVSGLCSETLPQTTEAPSTRGGGTHLCSHLSGGRVYPLYISLSQIQPDRRSEIQDSQGFMDTVSKKQTKQSKIKAQIQSTETSSPKND